MNYFILLKYLYLFVLQNRMLFSKDIKCSGKCVEKFCSLKLGIFVLATQLPDSSQNSEYQFKTTYCFLIKTDKGNVIKLIKSL